MRRKHKITQAAMLSLLAATAAPGLASAGGLAPLEVTLGDGTVVRFSGQLNMGVLHYDDGGDSYTNFVDNDNSSSRVRWQGFMTGDDGGKMESNLEVEYQPLASNVISQLDDEPNWDFPATNIRKAEVAFSNERFGKLWLGQGSMASDGSAEVDNSGTAIIAYASISDTAGGYFFRYSGDGLSDVAVGDAFNDYDGLSRKLRVRYDTPTFYGFGLRTSYGENALAEEDIPLYDIAATYSGDFDAFKIDAALAYSHNDGSDTDIVSGSISGLHKPSGVSLTFAAANEDVGGNGGGYYGYLKLGYQHQFFDIGATSFSVDYYLGKDIAAAGSTSRSVGLAAVQAIDDYNLQLWALWRNYQYEDDAADYDDGQAVFGGAMFKF